MSFRNLKLLFSLYLISAIKHLDNYLVSAFFVLFPADFADLR